jgi:hypothetical protein
MDINNPVIVMALYDIGRENWNNFRMSYHTYGFWMRNTLSLDCNIVIYTESKFIDELTNYRREFDPNLEKTIFVENELNIISKLLLLKFRINEFVTFLCVSFCAKEVEKLSNIIIKKKTFFKIL